MGDKSKGCITTGRGIRVYILASLEKEQETVLLELFTDTCPWSKIMVKKHNTANIR